jgi:hypothetical protein
MKRWANLLLVALVAASAGCAMCQSPWDYCNATIGPNGCPYCDFGARAGSAFHPMGGTPPTTERGPTEARLPAADEEDAETVEPAAPAGSPDELP